MIPFPFIFFIFCFLEFFFLRDLLVALSHLKVDGLQQIYQCYPSLGYHLVALICQFYILQKPQQLHFLCTFAYLIFIFIILLVRQISEVDYISLFWISVSVFL